MWLHVDYQQRASGGPPDVATFSGVSNVELEVGMWMWISGDPLDVLSTSFTTQGLSTRDLGSASDADRGSGFKDHFASTQPRSGSE